MNDTEIAALTFRSLSTSNSYIFQFVGMFLCGLLALLTNPLILWTIWRQKSLHTGCFSLIAQMAAADFIVGFSLSTTSVKRLIRTICGYGEVLTQLQCGFELSFVYFSQSASLLLALMLGIERLSAAAIPIKFKIFQWKISRALSIIAWLLAFLDTCSMFIGVSASKIITICTLNTAMTEDFGTFQEYEKNVVIVLLMIVYAMVLVTLTVQLRTAKRQNQEALIAMKKNLQLKVSQMLLFVVIVYILLQLATRVGLAIIRTHLPGDQSIKIAPYLRMIMTINSGVHLFIYVSYAYMTVTSVSIITLVVAIVTMTTYMSTYSRKLHSGHQTDVIVNTIVYRFRFLVKMVVDNVCRLWYHRPDCIAPVVIRWLSRPLSLTIRFLIASFFDLNKMYKQKEVSKTYAFQQVNGCEQQLGPVRFVEEGQQPRSSRDNSKCLLISGISAFCIIVLFVLIIAVVLLTNNR